MARNVLPYRYETHLIICAKCTAIQWFSILVVDRGKFQSDLGSPCCPSQWVRVVMASLLDGKRKVSSVALLVSLYACFTMKHMAFLLESLLRPWACVAAAVSRNEESCIHHVMYKKIKNGTPTLHSS